MHKLETTETAGFGHLLPGRFGVVGIDFEALAVDLPVAAATARVEAVFPFALRAALTCLGDSFASAISTESPCIHVLRRSQAF